MQKGATNKDTSIRPKKSSRSDRSDKGVTHIPINKITTDQRGYANAQMSASSTDALTKNLQVRILMPFAKNTYCRKLVKST